MLVHKGGQINNVQLITGLRIAEMSQLQNCSVMCTKNGSYCENEKKKRERKSQGGRGMCTKNGSYCEKKKKSGVRGGGGGGGGGGGEGGRCERRSEAFAKIQKKKKKAFVKIQKKIFFFFFFWGGGRVGGQAGWMGTEK